MATGTMEADVPDLTGAVREPVAVPCNTGIATLDAPVRVGIVR